jgi:hypothetical protein
MTIIAIICFFPFYLGAIGIMTQVGIRQEQNRKETNNKWNNRMVVIVAAVLS